METVEVVRRGGVEAAAKVQDMTASVKELIQTMDSVSSIVEENTTATEKMAAESSEASYAIENIAAISEENNAAIEEVSASTEEMSAQVEEVSASAQSLNEMAAVLQQAVARFKLSEAGARKPGASPKKTGIQEITPQVLFAISGNGDKGITPK